ncbi:hypothetical protein, partial [Mycobacterium branderi]|uniref:hypothetical protein n=1 Tax=Mycobacterium branderi TaxID=43348 RepID=UPI001E398F6B
MHTAVEEFEQFERQEGVVQDAIQQRVRDAGNADRHHQQIDQPLQGGVHSVVESGLPSGLSPSVSQGD